MRFAKLEISERDFKDLVKTALEELMKEKPEMFKELIAEVIEDMVLGQAIEEGLKTPEVSEEEVFRVLGED